MEMSNSSNGEDNGKKISIVHPEELSQSCENNQVHENTDTSTFDFTEKSWRTDFVLIVEGTRLHVAKVILALASPVFDGMFRSEFKESLRDELELPGKNVEDMRVFLRCIYPNTLNQITQDNALKVLPLLEEYQVVQLKPKCETVLCESISKETPIEELLSLMEVATRYNLSVLCEKCATLAADNTEKVLDEAISNCSSSSEAQNVLLRKMINVNRARIKELEKSNAAKSKEIDTIKEDARKDVKRLKEINAELEEELDLFKQYFSAEIRNNDVFKCDNKINWKGCQLVLSVNSLNDKIQAEKEATLWGIKLMIRVWKGALDWLEVGISIHGGQRIHCDIKARFILVNRQPKGENRIAFIENIFSGIAGQNVCKYSEVEALSNGFMRDGRFGFIVNLYMSEPNKK